MNLPGPFGQVAGRPVRSQEEEPTRATAPPTHSVRPQTDGSHGGAFAVRPGGRTCDATIGRLAASSSSRPVHEQQPQILGLAVKHPRRLMHHGPTRLSAGSPDEVEPSRMTELVENRLAVARIRPHPHPIGPRPLRIPVDAFATRHHRCDVLSAALLGTHEGSIRLVVSPCPSISYLSLK